MGEAGAVIEAPAAPRRRDAAATRAAILEAAKTQFALLGYDRAALRDIAGAAGADVALIKRYFGGKEALFTEALRAAFRPRFADWDRASFPREMATMMADGVGADDERTASFQFLLRAATSPSTAPLLGLAMQEKFLGPIREWLGGDEAAPRARVLAAVFIGLLVERLIRGGRLSGPERELFIEETASVLETLIR